MKRAKIKWKSLVDDRPAIGSPRIKFSRMFGMKYLNGANRVLDIGCGIGSYTYLVDRNNTVGIDLDLKALNIAKLYCTNSNFILASVQYLPFREEVFDVVCMWEVMEYIEKKTESNAVREVYRILNSNSFLLLSAPNSHLIYNIMDPDHFVLRRQRHFVMRELLRLIIDTGFSINQKIIKGNWKTIIAMNSFYLHKHLLNNRGGKIQFYLDKKSEEEFISDKTGITNIFIAAQKVTH